MFFLKGSHLLDIPIKDFSIIFQMSRGVQTDSNLYDTIIWSLIRFDGLKAAGDLCTYRSYLKGSGSGQLKSLCDGELWSRKWIGFWAYSITTQKIVLAQNDLLELIQFYSSYFRICLMRTVEGLLHFYHQD